MEGKPEDFDFDYRSHLFAIRCLLSRQRVADEELAGDIEKAGRMAAQTQGPANENWVEEQVDRMHDSVYQDAAHSMAAVGMLAPFMEAAFKRTFRHMGKEWPRKQDTTETIMKYVCELGMKGYMPDDLNTTLQTLFAYRNKMFHFGFEWPLEERQKFEKSLLGWPSDWFDKATSDDEPWMFYMTPKFVDHCVERAEQVIEGIREFEIGQRGVE